MKKETAIFVLLFMWLAAAVALARAEVGFDGYLTEHYVGWEAVSFTANGDAAAVVLRQGDKGTLVVQKGKVIFENPAAVDGCRPEDYSVYLDTDTDLFFTCRDSETHWQENYHFVYVQGQWLLGDIYFLQEETAEAGNDEVTVLWDYTAGLLDDQVLRDTRLEDENENLLWEKQLPPLPDVLTEEERDLAHWSHQNGPLHAWGYRERYFDTTPVEVCRRVLDALKTDTPYAAYTCVDGLIADETLQFVADRPDGSRVLLCGSWEEDLGWQFVESTPLPAGTTMGIENMISCLNLGGARRGPSIQRFSDGTWGVYMLENGELPMLFMGQNWVSENGSPWEDEGTYMGDHPWSDITVIDWTSLPSSLEEALRRLNSSRWATPNNSNPRDRLNLRERPDKASGSLGKYYNGTPVQVLEKGKEWTKVRVGPQVGYMMTRYLAFGEEMRSVEPYNDMRFSSGLLTHVYWQVDQTARTKETVPTLPGMMFIGVADGDWYLVWDYHANRFGRIRADELWEGNG